MVKSMIKVRSVTFVVIVVSNLRLLGEEALRLGVKNVTV